MARVVLINGRSGSGKSTSVAGLDADKTVMISLLGKELPFPGASKLYRDEPRDGKFANWVKVKTARESHDMIVAIANSEKAKGVTSIVVDDSTFTMVNEFMARSNEDSWDKWQEMANDVFEMIQVCQTLRNDLVVFFLWHDDAYKTGDIVGASIVRRAKTLGKLFDEKLLGVEPMFNMVLFSHVDPIEKNPKKKYFFVTQNVGNTTAKTPMNMFGKLLIPNDLGFVRQRMDEYYLEGKTEDWDDEANVKAYEQLKQSAF